MPDIRHNFILTGADAVENGYLRIGTAAQRMEQDVEGSFRGTTTAAKKSARDVETTADRSAKRRISAEDRVYSEAEKDAARYTRQFEAEARAKEKAAERSAAAIVKSTERAAKQRENAERASAKRSEREEKKSADRKAREHTRALEHVARIRDRHLEDEQRKRDTKASKIAQEEERASKKVRDKGRSALGSIGSGIRSGILTGAATGGALATGFVGAAAKDELKLQETANRISINARQAGQGYLDPATLRKEFEATAMATPGVKSSEVADAVQRFITLTGDVDTARKWQRTFATVASATGANVGNVAEAAASISQQFDIKGLEEMRDVLAALTYQGKAGSFELADAAAQFQRLAASGGAFGVEKSVQGVKTLGGLTQIARSGTGSGESAATAVENLFTNLKTKSGDLKDADVNVYKDGKVRDVRQIIVESIAKVGGNDIAAKQEGLSKIFGEQGIRAINPLISRYNDTFQSTKGTDAQKRAAGMEAISAQLQKAIDAPGTWADVVLDAAQAQRDSSAKVTAAFERIKAAAGDQLLPALLQLEPTIPKFVDAISASIPIITSFAEVVGKVAGLLAGFTTGGGDSARRAAEAGSTVTELQGIAAKRPLTPEEQKQLAGAQKEQTAAQREQDFISRFTAADTSSTKSLTDKQIDAKAYYDRLQKNPEAAADYAKKSAMVPFSVPFLVSGQNDAQAKIVGDEADRVTADRKGSGSPVVQEVEQAKTGLADLARSLAAATAAANTFTAQQRPSILAGQ